ncbi:type III-B CRISPR module-associated protein Cmr3 [Neisseria cinerea]|uniref:CRISPR-associated protein, Cmr3 family n=1 Tax=Neisseria cinerea ATCC 14685 TaxID=546262 RepID=D0W1J1_NEICI|nr:type III-B CRISPR module-associated protein Cmr3 [Neisseria cinerea]EEZ72117.1 CRISPR-associated protein, Cmr3 family [Neisseria cinerea ATCC 14685]MCD2071553.1 type III-B CRISPR module-associated protein Cmr3 [Neisseria cinerea]
MNSYFLDALAPLVFRSGKPFGVQSDTDDIQFPLPSTAAGLVRTQFMHQNGWDWESGATGNRAKLSDGRVAELRQIAVQGAFLAKQDVSGNIKVMLPKPANALYLKNKGTNQIQLVRLAPEAFGGGVSADFPHNGLLPVQVESQNKGKPQSGAAYWDLEDLLAWQNGKTLSFEDVNKHGVQSLPIEARTHIAINRETLSAKEGILFQTAAYDLSPPALKHHQGWEGYHYGFIIRTEADLEDNGIVRFGGEGRLSRLNKIPDGDSIFNHSESTYSNGFTLTLITPALFEQGWLPGWLDKESLTGILPHTGLQVRLRATAIDRWQPVSGWDLQKHAPKAMRKAVNSGAVYWFEILGGNPAEIAQAQWQAFSDSRQDCLDGFGIGLVAPWQNI